MGDWDSHLNIFICRTINHLEAQHERLALDTAPDHRVTLSGGLLYFASLYHVFICPHRQSLHARHSCLVDRALDHLSPRATPEAKAAPKNDRRAFQRALTRFLFFFTLYIQNSIPQWVIGTSNSTFLSAAPSATCTHAAQRSLLTCADHCVFFSGEGNATSSPTFRKVSLSRSSTWGNLR
jgi:hypothetical protein